jgi:hypothetical protein
MEKFHIKSIILGVGIGTVITAITSMVYLAGVDPSKSLSKDEIIQLAKQYGMVESKGIIVDDSNKVNLKNSTSGTVIK